MNNKNGQTALILILLTAAALIFLAITLNWGKVSQTKSLLTIAADQSAALLASDAASYGEMQKQGNLKDQNQLTSSTGIFLYIILVIVAIVVTVWTWGAAASPMMILIAHVLAVLSIVMAVANLALQIAVVQPGITSLWNGLQKSQPTQQQFYEAGVGSALQGAVTDQSNITDYLDWNANGTYGYSAQNAPNDSVGRFALFYSDRLKMLNQPDIPQVVYFYDQLEELMNGYTCAQNANDMNLKLGAPENPACVNLIIIDSRGTASCTAESCQIKIPPPNDYQLSDTCASNSNPNSTNPVYTPYCDPCCQPIIADPLYCAPGSANCSPNPLHPSPYITNRPSNCSNTPQPQKYSTNLDYQTAMGTCAASPNSSGCVPSECYTNNPFNTSSTSSDSQYPYLYDPTYQSYNNQTNPSFLDLFGRDMQMPPFSLAQQGDFPNGIYPFFWLGKDYSLEVDNINASALTPGTISPVSPQLHWCAPATAAVNGVDIPVFTTPSGFKDLDQLNLGYACQNQDCCVNYLGGSVIGGVLAGGPAGIPMHVPATNDVVDMVGADTSNLALDPSFGEPKAAPQTPWLEGDNQLCSPTFPYNGASLNLPDGSCEWGGNVPDPNSPAGQPPIASNATIDSLDDTMHTLSDFVTYANKFLNTGVDTLSSNFSTWQSQAADWVAPSPNGKLAAVLQNLNLWGDQPGHPGLVTNWLTTPYANDSAWCVPSTEQALLNGSPSTDEDNYIQANNDGGPWGDLLMWLPV